ncbi:MAG: hypothetical protein DIZ77_05190 [endosymbiont of Seepiophila jonesi]|uniref:Core-binding (CB) domain-containing protein n=1 Tax=endosymbiont of Lamellibrachia luymesi TaxID=2200907 RepID=A0A370E1F1_9GAMM|nr:MAG: hypothetical protein DIZ79_00760 [endosymbiont of Lamellibrachia luymesi]RDH93678.1 MAG: hypothetical protein DIZ77_05190 [endosymbiont of Seepiophila jonesi]
MIMKPTDFSKALSHYLAIFLPGQRNVSTNTIKSYRDTFKLLLLYCKQDCHLSIERLCLRHIDRTLILGFLGWLEKDRNNSVSTRNQRLACIHGFYRYMQIEDPVGLLPYQQILSIPIKKTQTPTIHHLTPEALKLILEQPDPSRSNGRRDWLFSDTPRGARASATCYSLIETAKANGLEPYAYLHHVLQHIAAADTLEKIEALLPWNMK